MVLRVCRVTSARMKQIMDNTIRQESTGFKGCKFLKAGSFVFTSSNRTLIKYTGFFPISFVNASKAQTRKNNMIILKNWFIVNGCASIYFDNCVISIFQREFQ